MATKIRKPLFDRLRIGLEEGIGHARGELVLKTTHLPEEPPEIDAETLVAFRKAADMSQTMFARVLYVSPKTVQSWEQGIRVPSLVARRLIHILAEQPATVCQVIGLPAVDFPGFAIRRIGKGKRRIVKR